MRRLIPAIVFFVIALYIVEASPIGSSSVAKFNHGYGTFDMKKYDARTVNEVLEAMEPMGFHVYKLYYVADDVFLIVFGLLQIILLQMSFSWIKHPLILQLLCLIPILRGVMDLLENTILMTTLFRYPSTSAGWIGVAAVATTVKLLLIKVWGCAFLVGIIGQVVNRIRLH